MHKQVNMKKIKLLWIEQSGISSIECALLDSLIAVVILVAVASVGKNLLSLWTTVKDCVSFAVSQSGTCA